MVVKKKSKLLLRCDFWDHCFPETYWQQLFICSPVTVFHLLCLLDDRELVVVTAQSLQKKYFKYFFVKFKCSVIMNSKCISFNLHIEVEVCWSFASVIFSGCNVDKENKVYASKFVPRLAWFAKSKSNCWNCYGLSEVSEILLVVDNAKSGICYTYAWIVRMPFKCACGELFLLKTAFQAWPQFLWILQH